MTYYLLQFTNLNNVDLHYALRIKKRRPSLRITHYELRILDDCKVVLEEVQVARCAVLAYAKSAEFQFAAC